MKRSLAVLLVEDEVLIRMNLSDMLDELGHRVAGEAGDIESASSFHDGRVRPRHPRHQICTAATWIPWRI
ncbi:hypothetical protein [Bradyrhizobium sp. SEMIA]|uniref:hypothetical protein n=1 Tax=Bradyrhizobium sp. SEMIA TaxID=2597515 RepID=UPI003A102679